MLHADSYRRKYLKPIQASSEQLLGVKVIVRKWKLRSSVPRVSAVLRTGLPRLGYDSQYLLTAELVGKPFISFNDLILLNNENIPLKLLRSEEDRRAHNPEGDRSKLSVASALSFC